MTRQEALAARDFQGPEAIAAKIEDWKDRVEFVVFRNQSDLDGWREMNKNWAITATVI